jgi:hypothetical protein
MRTATITILAIAAASLAGCGPRVQPDQSLRPVPAKTEPTATIKIEIQPQRLATDTSFALPMTMALLPVASAFTPGVGGDGIASAAVVNAIRDEVQATKAAKVVSSGSADYVLTGQTKSDDSLKYHNCGLGIVFYVGILPYFCGAPNKSYSMESAAEITLVRADGTTLLRRDYERSQWWTGSKYSADDPANQPVSRYPLNAQVCGREVAFLVASDVAAAIAADQAAAKP